MATPKKTSSNNGRPPHALRFTRRTSSGHVVSLSPDDDLNMSGDYTGGSDGRINYTVLMPSTPDNQPGSTVDSSGASTGRLEGLSEYGTERQRGGDSSGGTKADQRRMSLLRSNSKSMLLRSQTGDFDHNRWLFQTKGKYGIGTAYWSEEDAYDMDDGMTKNDFLDKPWKPLTRKIKVPFVIISPYRSVSLNSTHRPLIYCSFQKKKKSSVSKV
ncbi:hypothetical protein Nepgr_030090 [Nepenthes gracilis]|uniref:Uncharacterized protein n=1 Tax=Nepenthes gracilis TaxID=150966 RepID=A0AAD3TGK2_NEPGR|nr:hypothetical protein Nepgr_030090 [Nepenthes gracilis]